MASLKESPKPQDDIDAFRPSSAVSLIAQDLFCRLHTISSRVDCSVLFSLALIPAASATENFIPQPSNDTTVTSDIDSMITLLNFNTWRSRANAIRDGNNLHQCVGNLSLALSAVGPLAGAAANGSSGALSLLPTAGALIGTPTKELWVVYKLMPLAGVLSMLLSLGGTLVPTHASDYELNTSTFSYGGFIATGDLQPDDVNEAQTSSVVGPEDFAVRVVNRANDVRGGQKYMRVWYGIILQCLWLLILLLSCWFTQSGAIVAWWCQAWGWMLTWYVWIAGSSLLENTASVPFTHQWTMRVSKAPKVRISDEAPLIRAVERVPTGDSLEKRTSVSPYAKVPTVDVSEDTSCVRTSSPSFTETIDVLENGMNCKGRVIMDKNEPWSASRSAFYVIISLEGVSTSHAALRVVSKAISVGVFAAGTATFASATFVTISVALTVLCLVLGAGVFGRVIAMWMAAELIKTRPVLHRVVKSKAEANKYMEHIFAIDGLTIEVMGHVIVNGRCIKRYSMWSQWSRYIGILAAPYNITKLGMSS